jgi:hypothetical protein
MTFRIFDDNARKAISEFIIGSPTFAHDRFGSISGTDVPQAAPNTGEYTTELYPPPKYCVGSTCSQPAPSTSYPPPTGLHHTLPEMDCTNGIPAQGNQGNCPDGYIRKVDGNRIPYCCPMEPSHPGHQQLPAQLQACGAGYSVSEVSEPFKLSEDLMMRCHHAGGDVKYDAEQSRYYCCSPEKQTDAIPPTSAQPLGPQYPVKPTPAVPAGVGAIQLAQTLVDIPGGSVGLVAVNNMSLPSTSPTQTGDVCQEVNPTAYNLVSDATEGNFTTKAACDQFTSETTPGYKPLKCYNPGSATIPKATNIVVGLKAKGTKDALPASIWIALVVPCS